MDEEVSRAFYMGFSAVLFVIAVTLLLCYQQKLNDIYETLYYRTMQESILIEGDADE